MAEAVLGRSSGRFLPLPAVERQVGLFEKLRHSGRPDRSRRASAAINLAHELLALLVSRTLGHFWGPAQGVIAPVALFGVVNNPPCSPVCMLAKLQAAF